MPANLWTDKEVEQARELYKAGYRPQEIAEALGRGTSGVACKLQKLGLHYQFVQPWSEEDIAALKDMRADNVTVESIAAKLGRTKNAVYYIIKTMDLPPSSRPFGNRVSKNYPLTDTAEYTRHCTISHLQDIHRHHGFDKVWASIETPARYIKHVGVAA